MAYLLLNRQRVHHREVLASLFWGDHTEIKARSCLSTALWRLRRALDQTDRVTYLKKTQMGEVGFNNESNYWLDVEEFETQASKVLKKPVRVMAAEDAAQLENALSLYKGELLEGFYDDWALRERERLHAFYIKSVKHLMKYYDEKSHDYEKAIVWGKHILEKDPLREGIHRDVMRYYSENGNRSEAIRHYEHCCKILKTELGVEPMSETVALIKKIASSINPEAINESLTLRPGGVSREEAVSLSQIFKKINHAMDDIDGLREKLQYIAQMLERSVK